MEQLLQWNPNDNQGVRLIIGSEYLRAGDRAMAGKVLREHADEYPPYRYELGLLHLQKQKWAEAATSLRHGFVNNPYIPEILCGNPAPMPLRIWEGSNWQGAETAREYVGEYGELWRWTADALEFLRWLHTHPRVMAERAAGHRMPAGTALGERLPRQRTNSGPGTGGAQRHRVGAVTRDHQAADGPQRRAHGALEGPEHAGMAGRALESGPSTVAQRHPTMSSPACRQHQQADTSGRRCIGYRQQPGRSRP